MTISVFFVSFKKVTEWQWTRKNKAHTKTAPKFAIKKTDQCGFWKKNNSEVFKLHRIDLDAIGLFW